VSGLPSWLGPGSRIAGYRLEEFIGAGGMAQVFRAYHEGMGRGVALKVLAAGLTVDEAFRRRFVREARSVATVEHPHIIPVYEAGEAPVPFIAMRLVRGGDLRAMVARQGPMPAGRAAAFVSPVASALDTAHEAGLVHRDVKPANMLVDTGPGRPEHVYLTDFGLARGLTSAGMNSGGLTTPGQFMGTPEYAAPEQITGGQVDGRADQYALACVAYTLLTGSAPYQREQALAVMYAQLYDPAPLVTAARPDLPAAVNDVMARALEKKPDARFESCTAFADALRAALGFPPWGAEGTSTYAMQGAAGDPRSGYPPIVVAPRPPVVEGTSPVARMGAADSPGTPPTSAPVSRAVTWTAVVSADRAYYDSVWAADISPGDIIAFPDGSPERRYPLTGTELLIGRRSMTRGIHPEIDLTTQPGGPATDTGVSREHAKLVATSDGGWSIIDLGTENGTLVNGLDIAPGRPAPLRAGDRINLGMWTAITLTRG
jgi:serine/threonine-protein kinase